MSENHKWFPFSSTAYGANALYVPKWGERKRIEAILVMDQHYPEFKTHPVLDYFHGYVSGAERFDKNHEYRVLGWDLDTRRGDWWSFLYLPTAANDVLARVIARTNAEGRLSLEIEARNPSDQPREWRFRLFICPELGLDFPYSLADRVGDGAFAFSVDAEPFVLTAAPFAIETVAVRDSNDWIYFPLNAEASYSDAEVLNRYKKRLRFSFAPFHLPAKSALMARIDLAPSEQALASALPPLRAQVIPAKELPYAHALWEAFYNRQYVESDAKPGKMVARVIPGRQWARFFLWDAGMTAIGAADMDPAFAEAIIAETPDPERVGDRAFAYGCPIVTGIYALWELYQKTLNKKPLLAYYQPLKTLLLAALRDGRGENDDGVLVASRGTGADDNPASFFVKNAIFAWDYRKTLPVHPSRQKKNLLCVGITCHAVRCLKILRNVAWIIGADGAAFAAAIEKAEHTLNKRHWDEASRCYLDRVEGEDGLLPIPWIYDWLPLFSGSAPRERVEASLPALRDTTKFMTEHGLVIAPRDSEYFRQDGYPNGSAWPPIQYFFWKAAYNIGEMPLARELSDTFLRTYERNHRETLCCWEQFRCDTGKGAGNHRFSGFLTPVIAIWAARRKFGRLQCPHDTIVESLAIRENGAKAKFVLVAPYAEGRFGFSVVLRPNAQYARFVNGVEEGVAITDAYGYLDFAATVEKNVRTEIRLVLRKNIA